MKGLRMFTAAIYNSQVSTSNICNMAESDSDDSFDSWD